MFLMFPIVSQTEWPTVNFGERFSVFPLLHRLLLIGSPGSLSLPLTLLLAKLRD